MQYSKEEVDIHGLWAIVVAVLIIGIFIAILSSTNQYYNSVNEHIKHGYVQTYRGYWVRPENIEVKNGFPQPKE